MGPSHDPGDTARPFGMNMLDAGTEDEKHFVVSNIIGLMYKLFDPNKTAIFAKWIFAAYFYQQKTLHDIAISAFQSGKKELALDIITADLSYAPYQAAA